MTQNAGQSFNKTDITHNENYAFSTSFLDRTAPPPEDINSAENISHFLFNDGCVLCDSSRKKLLYLAEIPENVEIKETVFLGAIGNRSIFAHSIKHDLGHAEGPNLRDVSNSTGHSEFVDIRSLLSTLTEEEQEISATGRAVLEWHNTNRWCGNCGGATTPGNLGKQRECGGCGKTHFPRTDPVVIMLVTRGDTLLVGRSAHFPEGMYSLLAGFVDACETIEAAVKREIYEEAGINVKNIRYLASQPWPFPHSLMIGCAAEAEQEALRIDYNELEDARWLSKTELCDIFMEQHAEISPPRRGSIARALMWNWLADISRYSEKDRQ